MSLATVAFMRWAITLFGVFVGGCALTSPAPGGPLHAGAYTQIQPSWAVAYGPASMTVDGVPVSGTVQSRNVGRGVIDPFPNPIPLAAGVRQALGPSLEASVDMGWVDSGVGLRLAIPSVVDPQALVISAGARSGRVSFFGDESYEGHLSIEAYPVIAGPRTRSLRLLLSVGVAAGTFVHELLLAQTYASSSDAPVGPPMARILRPEIRLQTSVGLFLSREHFGLAVALSPWILLRADEPTSLICQDCNGPHTITNYAQTWGVSLTIATSIGSDFTL
jgi:hypothetical protein